MNTRTIYKERCPICHRALKVDDKYKSLSYYCRDRYRHYEYMELDYGSSEDSCVTFTIDDYSIEYVIATKRFEVFGHNGKERFDRIISLPAFDFDWGKLDQLSERIKKLITFS